MSPMTKYPTPNNPLVLIYRGNIPAMKNDNQIKVSQQQGKNIYKLGRSKKIRVWLATGSSNVQQQRERQGFDVITEPDSIGVFVRLGIYISPKTRTGLPNNDLDNAYTTVQETWGENKVIENDRQVASLTVVRVPVRSPALEHTVAFIWTLDTKQVLDNPSYVMDKFLEFYEFYKSKTTLELLRRNNASDKAD